MSVQKKQITILGSTGSIGTNTLHVIQQHPDIFQATYLSTNTNITLLEQQVKEFTPTGVVIANLASAIEFKRKWETQANYSLEILSGEESLCEVVKRNNTNFVVNALVGFSGLKPTLAAIENGKNIGLANKETLVVAGNLINQLLKKHNVSLLPIDSEHSAIFQCLVGEEQEFIHKIILTASGGPFRKLSHKELERVTLQDALKHPNWSMGKKITIDSATMMNKGLEVIEAYYLFGLHISQIDIVIHPQSIIHSMVEFCDGNIKAQLSLPDMKTSIQYALTHPSRLPLVIERINWNVLRLLEFETPDFTKFHCLKLAFQSLTEGECSPLILNAANEMAVALFLQSKISFLDIPSLIDHTLQCIPNRALSNDVNNMIALDKEVRTFVQTQATRPKTYSL